MQIVYFWDSGEGLNARARREPVVAAAPHAPASAAVASAIAELLVASWRDSDDEDWSCSKEPDAPNHQERSKEVYVPFPL